MHLAGGERRVELRRLGIGVVDGDVRADGQTVFLAQVLEDERRVLHGDADVLAAQVGNTLFGNDDVDIMLAVVHMGNHRYDGADFAFFGYGRAGEDGDVGVTCKVARTADTVHHLRTANLGRVYMSVDVHLDGRIQRAYADAGDDFGAV